MFFVFILALASGLHREDAGRSNLWPLRETVPAVASEYFTTSFLKHSLIKSAAEKQLSFLKRAHFDVKRIRLLVCRTQTKLQHVDGVQRQAAQLVASVGWRSRLPRLPRLPLSPPRSLFPTTAAPVTRVCVENTQHAFDLDRSLVI